MNSVRSSIAMITELNRKAIDKLLKPLGLTVAIVTKVDNKGIVIKHKK